MPVTEDRTIRLDRDALAEALARDGATDAEVALDVERQVLRTPWSAGEVREFAGAGLAVLVMRHLARLKVPLARDAAKRVVVAEDGVSLVLRRVHPAPR